MLNELEISRGLKDKDYFQSLQPAERQAVVAAGGIGASEISDESLESVSSGLEGGTQMMATGTDAQTPGNASAMVICHC